MTDAFELFRQMRPPTAPAADSPTTGQGRDLHDLAMVPGSASYRSRIPPPPCYQCGEDHVPGQSYNHSWMPEPVVHDEPVSASVVTRRTAATVEQVMTTPFRVALYVGRGDTYVVSVESAPDWDAVTTFKVAPEMVLPLIKLARALAQKVVDKTGGDLLMLEQEEAARSVGMPMLESDYAGQHEKTDGRRATADGDHGSRRTEPDPDGAEESPEIRAEPPNGSLPGGRRQRRHPAG